MFCAVLCTTVVHNDMHPREVNGTNSSKQATGQLFSYGAREHFLKFYRDSGGAHNERNEGRSVKKYKIYGQEPIRILQLQTATIVKTKQEA